MGLSPLSILVQLYHGTTFMVIFHQQVSLIDETEITGEKHQYVVMVWTNFISKLKRLHHKKCCNKNLNGDRNYLNK
jgi:hypothetical protein